MQITGNHQMARIVRHNDESVREGYIRNGGKEVKLFTSALKAFQCNNRIVMAQRKHWMIFYVVELSDDCNVDVPSWKYPRNLELLRVSSPGFGNDSEMMDESRFSLKSDSRRTFIWRAPGTRYHQENTIERHRYGGAGWLVWGGIILGSRTDLHVQSVTMTGHIYRDVILEQHVRLFRGAICAEFLFMDDNARPHRANIVDECLQSEDITRMDWPAYSPDLNPIEHVWDMLGRRIAARQPPPTCLPELRRALLDEWCNILQDQIDNLILSMPRRCKACIASSGRHTPY
ncbi:Transposable element Tc3 transposase [Araneus ventricosus]|uniref:Transposable element Tc3 transposase n=1 Tax=Araneus ventricosus TaxID=182803 RepID=A0A4Y2T600_ARAVE|nr:Transposable element Tc3 transposase [Araneus ventricosus]GBN96048.1 Transposable element Tc3 transposase [Araneus ventricosus]GBN97486.1 Transposable element Tc3 transposase [Araneus ventricosus]GBN97489.1 Transposable element Tc3 transposase [Araneus ventricosus]